MADAEADDAAEVGLQFLIGYFVYVYRVWLMGVRMCP